jgi:putative transposase
VRQDQYLLELIRYIHQNPQRAKLVKRIEEYPYTSERNYRHGIVSEIVEPRTVLSMLGGTKGYRKFVQEGEKEGHREAYYQVEDQRFLGAKGFGEKLKERHGEEENEAPKKGLSVVYRNIARAVGIEPEVLGGADRGWQVSRARAVVGYVLIRRLGYRLKDVAKYLGRDMATVSSLISRHRERMDDRELRSHVERLVKFG